MIKKYFQRRVLSQPLPVANYLGWKQLKTCILLYSRPKSEIPANILALRDVLQKEGKEVFLFAHQSGKKPKENAPLDCYFGNDLNWMGMPKASVLSALPSHVHLLINWSGAKDAPNAILAKMIVADFVVGINQNLSEQHIEINCNEEKTAVNELLKYLKLINND